MNVLMVLSAHKFPPDRRVEREAEKLIKQGHNVFLLARKAPGQAICEIVNQVKVIRFFLPFQKTKNLSDFIYLFFQRYLIFFNIIITCCKHKIDVLHVHDLPYALATTLAGKLLRKPVIFDSHEHYVEMLRPSFNTTKYKKLKPLSFILLNMLKLDEKIACRLANKIILVTEEHIPRFESLGAKKENIFVVTNTEDTNMFNNIEIDKIIINKYSGDFVILYTGGFGPHRGLETAIKAMPIVLKEIPNAKLVLVGDGIDRKELEELTNKLDLDNKVIFTGFLPFSTFPTYINLCDIGLIPHISTPHIEMTMPNKIFQFMMLEKPVIVSNTKPMTRIVQETNCGLVFKERDETSLAEKIIEMKNDNTRKTFGQNGKKAVYEKYNWDNTAKILIELYEQIMKNNSKAKK